MKLNYKTEGVCSKEIDFSIENGKVRNVSFKLRLAMEIYKE